MLSVEKINNGFLLKDTYGKEMFYANEKKLVVGIRELLGLRKLGRPPKKNKLAEGAAPF